MIRLIIINIANFINSWLPVHRRKPGWLSFLQVLFAPFKIMMEEWILWRDRAVTKAYVNTQRLSLAWYLNSLFDPVDQEIYIDTPVITGVHLALQSELVPVLMAGLESEISEVSDYTYVPFPGEDAVGGNVDFIVFAPAVLVADEEAIRKVVSSYKLAGMRWTIIYF